MNDSLELKYNGIFKKEQTKKDKKGRGERD